MLQRQANTTSLLPEALLASTQWCRLGDTSCIAISGISATCILRFLFLLGPLQHCYIVKKKFTGKQLSSRVLKKKGRDLMTSSQLFYLTYSDWALFVPYNSSNQKDKKFSNFFYLIESVKAVISVSKYKYFCFEV